MESVPRGETVNQHYYQEVLQRLREQTVKNAPSYGETRTGSSPLRRSSAHCFAGETIFGR